MASRDELGLTALTGALALAAREVQAFAAATRKAQGEVSRARREEIAEKRNARVRTAVGGAVAGGLVAAGVFAARSALAARRNGSEFGPQATADLARAASAIDPRIANRVEPVDRAVDRVGAITEQIARFGGTVTDEQRQRLFDVFSPQERRAQSERQALARLANQGVAQASGGEAALSEVKALLQRIANAVEKLPF